jgi:DNA-binding NtrC family response regulator
MVRSDRPILVVDDDRTITRILRSMLEIEGYRVEEATSAVGLIDRIVAAPPSLLLLDLHMPVLSGLEVLTALGERIPGRVPVIMLTGDSQNIEHAVEALRKGASEYLVKPVAMDKLHAAVRSTLRLHALGEECARLTAELQQARERLAGRPAGSPADAIGPGTGEARLDRLFDGVVRLDRTGRIVSLNAAAARIAGAGGSGVPLRADLPGRPAAEVFRGELFAGFVPAETRDGAEVEVVLAGLDGVRRTVRARFTGLAAGDTEVVLGDVSEARALAELLGGRFGPAELKGESAAMREVAGRIDRASASDGAVLIEGEPGTGKRHAARTIHFRSRRASASFVTLSCVGIGESLLEAELFGAAGGPPGRLEVATAGTLLLEEVGELPPLLQLRLQQALEHREFSPAAGGPALPLAARLIATSSRALGDLVRGGGFRDDLRRRLHTVSLYLPPLRARREDLPALLDHFLARASARLGRPKIAAEPAFLARLFAHHWPGNIEELRRIVFEAAARAKDDWLTPKDLPAELGPGPRARRSPVPAAAEHERLVRALAEAGGNRSEAARRLGIGRTTLWRRLRRGPA